MDPISYVYTIWLLKREQDWKGLNKDFLKTREILRQDKIRLRDYDILRLVLIKRHNDRKNKS